MTSFHAWLFMSIIQGLKRRFISICQDDAKEEIPPTVVGKEKTVFRKKDYSNKYFLIEADEKKSQLMTRFHDWYILTKKWFLGLFFRLKKVFC